MPTHFGAVGTYTTAPSRHGNSADGASAMYTAANYPTKRKFREAFEAGKHVHVFQPGPFTTNMQDFPEIEYVATIEGPHYPKPHTWYASVLVKNTRVTKIIA